MGAREGLLQLLQLKAGECGSIPALLTLGRVLVRLAVAVGVRNGAVGAAAGAAGHRTRS